jgi:hypothetical protein
MEGSKFQFVVWSSKCSAWKQLLAADSKLGRGSRGREPLAVGSQPQAVVLSRCALLAQNSLTADAL